MNLKEALHHLNKLGAGAAKRKYLIPDLRKKAVMKEFYRGTLHAGSGEIVHKPQQAMAIAYSEAIRNRTK